MYQEVGEFVCICRHPLAHFNMHTFKPSLAALLSVVALGGCTAVVETKSSHLPSPTTSSSVSSPSVSSSDISSESSSSISSSSIIKDDEKNDDKDKDENDIDDEKEGVVSAKTKDTVVLKSKDGMMHTFIINGTALLHMNGKLVSLTDLKLGDEIDITILGNMGASAPSAIGGLKVDAEVGDRKETDENKKSDAQENDGVVKIGDDSHE